MTLKEILNNVLAQSGFLEKGSFSSSNDPDDKQMMAIANRVAYEIMNFYNWNELIKTAKVELVTNQYLYPLPDDYQSYIPDSAWETDGSRKVDIPVSDQMWYQYKFSSLTDGGVIRARFVGKNIEVIDPNGIQRPTDQDSDQDPLPPGTDYGDEFSYAYISKYPILASTTVPKAQFTSDSDTFLLDDQLLILGIQAHWQQTKMMPTYMEHMANYMVKMNEAISRSNQGQTIGGRQSFPLRSPYTKLWVN